jgi:hypothetical protein|tara:strand:- start:667 stop:3288 length:2622 start_codon:yes stop_codon:yes gene_type:complete
MKFDTKLSNLLGSQIPEFAVEEHPKFMEFVKTYYQFMESAKLSVNEVQTTDGILLETETNQENSLILDGSRLATDRTPLDTGDKLLQESSTYGKFEFGEIVIGETSKAKATILGVDIVNGTTDGCLFISAQNRFITGEIITGETSGASATTTNYQPNPVNNIQDLINFRDPDGAIDKFLANFREEFLKTVPESLDSGVDKRKLIKNVRSMYRAKGTQAGHELFFRLLFAEESETLYPRENLLKPSDGKFTTNKILRTVLPIGEPTDLIGKVITGATSLASATVENVFKFQIGADSVSEFLLNKDTIVGTFAIGEIIQGQKEITDDVFIKSTITGVLSTETITNDGALYTNTDSVSITGGGQGAFIQVDGIGSGPISNILLDNRGANYSVGDQLVFNNTNTDGAGAAGFVAVVGGAMNLEDGTLNSEETEDHILLEEGTTQFDLYSGQKIVQESLTSNTGEITDLFFTSKGGNYTSLPTVSVTSSTGQNAILKVFGDEIGTVKNIKVIEQGIGHQNSPSPSVVFTQNIIVGNISGTFVANETVSGSSSGKTGKVVSFDTLRGLLVLSGVDGSFTLDEQIVGASSTASANVRKFNVATATFGVTSVTDTDGSFVNEDGFLSETTMKIQDSLYYQEFSYVLKVGSSINTWRDAFKSTMHTAGFYFSGQVSVQNRINMQVKFPITGQVSGTVDSPLFSIMNTLFSTIFGRRLGTVSDGTSLRPKAHKAGKPDFDTSTLSPFSNTSRDITLRSKLNIEYTSRVRLDLTDQAGITYNVRQGYAFAGPRFKSVNREALRAYSMQGTGYTFEELSKQLIHSTRTGLDGQPGIMIASLNDSGMENLKMNLTVPAEIGTNKAFFSNTITKFDSETLTFDKTTE